MKQTLSNLKAARQRYKIMLYTCKQTDHYLMKQIQKEIDLIDFEINLLNEQKKRRKKSKFH